MHVQLRRFMGGTSKAQEADRRFEDLSDEEKDELMDKLFNLGG